MHFSYLYLLKDYTLDDVTRGSIEESFCDDFCYCCGETNPYVFPLCDWFQIGGRWGALLEASKGLKGSLTLLADEEEKKAYESSKNFDIVEIKDLTGKIDRNRIYGLVDTMGNIYTEDEFVDTDLKKEELDKILDKIDNKEINGVLALIDCHD